jgi:PhnB protein
MAGKVKAVPEGLCTVTPSLSVRDGNQALEFYKKAFGAGVKGVFRTPDGKVAHAEFKIGDSVLMLADEFPDMGFAGPETIGGSPVVLNVYVDNVDELFNQAIAAGAKAARPLANQFWGDRYGHLTDPFGHKWALAQHIEDVSPEEMERRGKEFFAQMAKSKGQG